MPVDRRRILAAVGVTATTAFAGCGWNLGPPPPGSLVVDNEDDRPHTVTVVVSKASDDSDDVPPRAHEAPGPTEPHWKREYRYEVPDRDEVTESGFVTDPGAYYFEARTETGLSASTWIGFYSAGGEQVGGGLVYVNVYEYEELSIGNPTQ